MLNKVMLIGRLGKDADIKYTSTGVAVCNFSLATDGWKKDGKKESQPEWHRIVAYGKLAEKCSEHLKKGRLIYIEGKLRSRTYEGKDRVTHHVTEVIADSIRFLGGNGKKNDSSDDDLPF